MKITLSQVINVEGDNFPYHVYKEFNHTVIPHVGCLITDTVWKKPYEYEVLKVIINYEDDTCYVSLAPYAYHVDSFKKYADMAKLHGWTSHLDKLNV